MEVNLKIIRTHKINPFIHSVFGEFLGALIYDGTWVGKDSTIPNYDGIRKDVVDGLKEAGVTAIRWPGGCFADHYYWKDGVGEKRNKRMSYKDPLNVNRIDPNEFGTDEFIKMCRLVGAEPILVANVASSTPEDFFDWFEYCNGDPSTKYGALRAQNGSPEPFNVRIWGIGNTDANVWQIAYNDPKTYAIDFLKWKFVIRGAQKGVKLIGLGLSERHETPGWVEGFLDYVTAGQHEKGPDSLSVHHYIGSAKTRYKKCEDAVKYSDEAYYYTLDALKAYQLDIDLHRKFIKEHTNPKYPTTICFDEWGLWNEEEPQKPGLRQTQTMRDAIFAACCFHLFYRHSDIVEFAMETQYSNVLQSLFETEGESFFKTPTFYVFKLFKDHLGQYLVPFEDYKENQMLDTIATASEDFSRITISVVNKHLYDAYDIKLPHWAQNYLIEASIIACDDVRSYNTYEQPYVIKDEVLEVGSNCTFSIPKHSIVRLTLVKG